ncbi:MAG: D-glycero-beta-D-manno-heptose 1,7-bisphosphate 7-phosphatase [Halioglobus sp.]|nr:D-glycero-beta-D-manno-heptose 1,7-bisphosphate 7-phosphatase [Halioglobus sp.]
MPLLILDRDGVINRDSRDYIRSVRDWQPLPGSIAAIARLSQAGYRIAIATNQSGLARGYFDVADLEAIHALLCQQVEQRGGRIEVITYCPHLPDAGCHCRKPATGLLQAIERQSGESARGAYFIGDSLKDLQAATDFGCVPILVTTGNGAATLAALRSNSAALANAESIAVYPDLAAAADGILRN